MMLTELAAAVGAYLHAQDEPMHTLADICEGLDAVQDVELVLATLDDLAGLELVTLVDPAGQRYALTTLGAAEFAWRAGEAA